MTRTSPWQYGTPERQWYGFGRYYAMFPPAFAYEAVNGLTRHGEAVLDPFCGRGNGPFTAAVLGRPTFGIDINPLAWLFTQVKLRPETDKEKLLQRLHELGRARKPNHRRGYSRFERMAWAPDVRALLRVARLELDWKGSDTDRTLMGFIVLHMQDKRGTGLSNGLWPTIACSPRYAVEWWTRHGFRRPPDVDPVELLTDRIKRRYLFGVPDRADGEAVLADAQDELPRRKPLDATLLLTSPPYNGVTDYWNDHWIRLWMLGHRMRKDWKRAAKHENRDVYKTLLHNVFREASRHLITGASVLVRSDRRRNTAKACIDALHETWPDQPLLIRESAADRNGVSVHHGRGGRRAHELDLLLPGERVQDWPSKFGFRPLEREEVFILP